MITSWGDSQDSASCRASSTLQTHYKNSEKKVAGRLEKGDGILSRRANFEVFWLVFVDFDKINYILYEN